MARITRREEMERVLARWSRSGLSAADAAGKEVPS